MRNTKRFIPLFILLVATLYHCSFTIITSKREQGNSPGVLSPEDRYIWQTLVAKRGTAQTTTDMTITYPYDGAVFPPEIAAPTFQWTDRNTVSTQWLVVVRFSDAQNPVYAIVDAPQWTPDKTTWETIKASSVAHQAEVAVFGVYFTPAKALASQSRIRISTSKDRVDASIF